jgi:hypothetical protein
MKVFSKMIIFDEVGDMAGTFLTYFNIYPGIYLEALRKIMKTAVSLSESVI